MPAKEIKELRQAGKLEEALTLANAELAAEPDNIWPKRNISWVYYEYLKKHVVSQDLDLFISTLNEIKNLQLPEDETMLFENLCWQIGKMAFGLSKSHPGEADKCVPLFEAIQSFHFPKPSAGYSFLFKALHKALKESDKYIDFADWWDFENFMPEDFQKEKMPTSREIMALAEQGYIAYAKHLLPKSNSFGESYFDKEKANAFLPKLEEIADAYPHFQYPAYFHAKLLLALGNKDHMLSALLPFARKKRNDFWVWQILAEAYSNEPDKVFACYCKALSCKSPEEMLVNLRQKMAGILIAKIHFNEAKTEIGLLVESRTANGFKIPNEVANWQSQDWYKTAVAGKSNIEFYNRYASEAEVLLFSDTPEEKVIVDFVNTDKKMLNFIASDTKFGYFKYDRFFKEIKVGDVLSVRLHSGSPGAIYRVYTGVKVKDDAFRDQFIKKVKGEVRIPQGRAFGFLEEAFVHPEVIGRLKLADGMPLEGSAIKTFNQEKKQWGWKFI